MKPICGRFSPLLLFTFNPSFVWSQEQYFVFLSHLINFCSLLCLCMCAVFNTLWGLRTIQYLYKPICERFGMSGPKVSENILVIFIHLYITQKLVGKRWGPSCEWMNVVLESLILFGNIHSFISYTVTRDHWQTMRAVFCPVPGQYPLLLCSVHTWVTSAHSCI